MKTLTLCLIMLLALGLALPASAQLRLGMIGGPNLANLRSPDTNDLDSRHRTRFGGGGVVELALGRWVALSMEPMYLQKGAQLDIFSEANILKLSYIEVPMLVKLSLWRSPMQPYLVIGSSVGFLRSARVSDKSESQKVDIKEFVNDRDINLIGGAGLRVPAGKVAIFVEGRYAYGLVNIFEESVTDVMTKGLQVMAGVTVPLGR
ncbi:MAG: PorT family protein [Candidatus Latescibacteria bacterium]|nr:PorT family protein [Candidatus Latescibacterota bacterium]